MDILESIGWMDGNSQSETCSSVLQLERERKCAKKEMTFVFSLAVDMQDMRRKVFPYRLTVVVVSTNLTLNQITVLVKKSPNGVLL